MTEKTYYSIAHQNQRKKCSNRGNFFFFGGGGSTYMPNCTNILQKANFEFQISIIIEPQVKNPVQNYIIYILATVVNNTL